MEQLASVANRRKRIPGTRASGTPLLTTRPAWFHARRLILLVSVSLLVVLGMTACGMAIGWSVRWGKLGAILVAVVVDHLLFGQTQEQLRRRVLDDQGQLCLKCGYLLAGTGSPGICPECGTVFDINDTTRIWLRWADPLGLRAMSRAVTRRPQPNRTTPKLADGTRTLAAEASAARAGDPTGTHANGREEPGR